MNMTTLAALALNAALAVESIKIPSADSFEITGRYSAGESSAPAVLLLHQCDRKTAETGFENLYGTLAAKAIHVLEIDFRGFGGSRDERFSDFQRQMDETTPHFRSDAEAAFQWLATRKGVDPGRIAIVAASCGATQAILLAGKHDVAAMVFVSASLWRAAREQLDAIADMPLLVVYASGDRFARGSIDAHGASSHKESRVIVKEGSSHGAPVLADYPDLLRVVVDWLDARFDDSLDAP